jgi:hypothetical protein
MNQAPAVMVAQEVGVQALGRVCEFLVRGHA